MDFVSSGEKPAFLTDAPVEPKKEEKRGGKDEELEGEEAAGVDVSDYYYHYYVIVIEIDKFNFLLWAVLNERPSDR